MKSRPKRKPISSNTLFHFTDSFAALTSILRNGFFPRYSLESLGFLPTALPTMAFPMVCFCDLPLSQAGTHLDIYGGFGIGLSKDWGKERGVSPVLYCYRDSNMAAHLDRAIDELEPKSSRKSDLFFKRLEIVMSIFAHIKRYEGTFRHHGKIYRDFRFYDEREWRFVPKNYAEFQPAFVLEGAFAKKQYVAHLESALSQKAPLTFQPRDIKCLVVERESYIPKLVDAIGRLRRIMPARDRKLLAARIISSDQIREDF